MNRSYLFAGLLLLALLLPSTVSAIGNISLTSNPAGAIVFLDGINTGAITPTTVENVTNSTHSILLRLSGTRIIPRIIFR